MKYIIDVCHFSVWSVANGQRQQQHRAKHGARGVAGIVVVVVVVVVVGKCSAAAAASDLDAVVMWWEGGVGANMVLV